MASDEAAGSPQSRRREIFAWALYDWANSAYSALSITILVYYIKSVVAPGWLGTIIYTWGIGLSMFLAAILSPITGALADANNSKRRWLAGTALPGAAAAALLAVVPDTFIWTVAALFFVAAFCFELSIGYYNAFLPELADDEQMNRVSAFGYALGYIGGGIALALAVAILGFGGKLGLPDGTELTKDFNYCSEGTFAVDLPDGDYEVSVTLGDPARPRDRMQIRLEGKPVDTLDTRVGEHARCTYRTRVRDGRLLLELVDLGGDDPHLAINALEIRGSGSAVPPFDFGTAGSDRAPGYIAVTGEDRYRIWDLEQEKPYREEDTPPLPAGRAGAAVPDKLAFGWTRGEVGSHDAVTPPRLRLGLLIMGLWWGLFSIPALLILKDRGPAPIEPPSIADAARDAVARVTTTIRNVRAYRMLALFLVGFLIYNDGIQTVLSQASVFAMEALAMPASELILVVLMIQFLALPGAWAVGRLADRFGQKPILMLCLAVWVALLVAAFFVDSSIEFWIMGAVLAMVMGGTQSVSRAIMGLMTPLGRSAEFFGFFNLSGKATSFMGPMLFGAILVVTGSPYLAIGSLLVFFITGWAIVAWLDIDRGRREARQAPTA